MAKTKILLVDDEEDYILVMKTLLSANNYEVATASDGVECMQKALKENFDLILLDIKMPIKDGFTTLKALKLNHITSGVPVVVITVSQHTSAMSECLKLGARDFLPKTLDSQEILKYIKKYASESPGKSTTLA